MKITEHRYSVTFQTLIYIDIFEIKFLLEMYKDHNYKMHVETLVMLFEGYFSIKVISTLRICSEHFFISVMAKKFLRLSK